VKIVLISLSILVFLFLPEILSLSATEIDLPNGNQAPSLAHPFGQDLKGRDLFARVIHGTRLSLMIGLAATLVSCTIGTLWGAVAGFRGGKVDTVMMRIVDVLFGLPFMFVVIILMAFVGRSILLLFLVLGLIHWLTMARVLRAEVTLIKNREFVQAARSLGCSTWRILSRHILPNISDTIIVYMTFTIPGVVLEEAFLSFLGLGVPAPEASLGTLVREGIITLSVHPWQLFFPAFFLLTIIFSVNWLSRRLQCRLAGQGIATRNG